MGNQAMVSLAQRATQGPGIHQGNYSDIEQRALDFLEQIGFLEPDPPAPTGQPAVFSSLVLLLTNQCHLRCTYCYASAGELPNDTLSEEHAYAAVDYFFTYAKEKGLENVTVTYHGGGEPTFAWNLMKKTTQYVRTKPLKSTVTLTTNAMWSRAQREWIFANIDSIGVSMDGMPDTQDRQRPLSSGAKSSPIVMRNLAEMDRRGIQYGIRMTATAPWESLPSDVEFICCETGSRTIQVEPAFNVLRGQHKDPDDQQWQGFADSFIQAYEVARRHNRRLYYSGARPGTVTTVFCTSPFDALVVAPRGKLVACYEITSENHPLAPLSSFGKIEEGKVLIDDSARARLHSLFSKRRETCRDCFCYWTCAGDCFARAFETGPEGHLVKGQRCAMNREITLQLLLSLIAEGDGVYDARRNPHPQPGPTPDEEEMYG